MCIIILIVYQVPYLIVNNLPLHRIVAPFILGEENIPLLPWTFLIYISAFIQGMVILRTIPKELLKKWLPVGFVLLLSSLFLFIVIPVEFPRYLYPSEHFFVKFYHWLDQPGNCFPSLHVSIAILLTACYSMLKKTKLQKSLMWLWTIFIIISVLTTKQHYLMDIFGGTIVVIPFIYLLKKERDALLGKKL